MSGKAGPGSATAGRQSIFLRTDRNCAAGVEVCFEDDVLIGIKSTALLFGEPLTPIMGAGLLLIIGGVLCIETGGPTPGLGCAGRGIITTFSLLKELRLFETEQPDVVLYDVLGDVVCGGFAAPIREGYAEKVLIVTSGEKMALYAANNIQNAVKNFEDRSYAQVRGIILNRRNVADEEQKVRAFADAAGL